jgi:hypothetical protein
MKEQIMSLEIEVEGTNLKITVYKEEENYSSTVEKI